MRSFRDRNPYAVGLISVLAIGVFTGIAFSIGLLHLLEHTYKVQAVFSDASGLRGGDKVRVAGVKVGRVIKVQADHTHGNVTVEFVVNHGVKVDKDATAEIALETLLGAKYIRLGAELSAGCREDSSHRDCLEDLPSSERVIPIENTKTPYDVFELTRVSTRNIEVLHTEQLNTIINDLADVTEGKQATITQLIDGLDKVSSAINARDAELRDLLDRADQLSATLADKDDTLVQLIDASQQILDLIGSRREQLAAALGEGAQAVTQLDRIVAEHRDELDRILSALHPTLAIVAEGMQPRATCPDTEKQADGSCPSNIDATLAWAGPAFYSQGLAASHGPWLDIFIRSLGVSPNQVLCDLLDPQNISGTCDG